MVLRQLLLLLLLRLVKPLLILLLLERMLMERMLMERPLILVLLRWRLLEGVAVAVALIVLSVPSLGIGQSRQEIVGLTRRERTRHELGAGVDACRATGAHHVVVAATRHPCRATSELV